MPASADPTRQQIDDDRARRAATRSAADQATMDAYVAERSASRPATTAPPAAGSMRPAITNMTQTDTAGMSSDDLDRLAALQERAKARKAASVMRLASKRMASTSPADLASVPAGQYTRDKALASMGDRGTTGAAISEGAQKVMDVTDRTDVRMASMAGRVVAGGDAANATKALAVGADLTGRALVAGDASIKHGLEGAQSRDIAATDSLADAADHLQSLPKPAPGTRAPRQADTPENAAYGEALMSTFRAAGNKELRQVQLGVHQDLSMKSGARDWSTDDTLGAQQAGELALPTGHVVSKADADKASLKGTVKRAIATGGLATAGKLSPERKQKKQQIEGDLADEQADRAQEARDTRALVKPTALQSLSTLAASGGRTTALTPAHEQELQQVATDQRNHVNAAQQTRTGLQGDLDSLRSQQPSLLAAMRDPQAKQQRADLQTQIDAASKKLADHEATHKAAMAGFDQRRKDVYSKAGGGFTSDELAARQEKQGQIRQLQTNATAEQRFVAQHEGKEINAHGRVGGIAEATDDADKRKGTMSGAIALGGNRFFKGTKRLGQVFGGNADDAQALVQQGEYALGGLTAASALTKEGLATASALGAPGTGAVASVPQAAIGGGLKGLGEVGMAVTDSAAKAEQHKRDATAVADGSRRAELRGKSSFTMNAKEAAPSVVGGLTGIAGAALSLDQVSSPIMDGTGVSDVKDKTMDALGIEQAPEGTDPGHAERIVGNTFGEAYGATADTALGQTSDAVAAVTAPPVAANKDADLAKPVSAATPTPAPSHATAPAGGQSAPWWLRAWRAVKERAKAAKQSISRTFSGLRRRRPTP